MKKIYLVLGITIAIIIVFLISYSNHPSKSNQNTTVSKLSYVALGDSVAAGDGLQNYSDSSACDRTNQSYPYLLAIQHNFKLTNLSCSGASLTAGIIGQQNVNDLLLSPQLSQLFNLPKPSIISLTIGANDIGWINFIVQCYTSTCGSSNDSLVVSQKISTMTTNLNTALSDIQKHYKINPPDVIVTGYYQIFPNTISNCNDISGLNINEINWVNQQQQNLNSAIENVVSNYTFAKFASINFTGHELCTASSWIQGINDSAPYHPNLLGQQFYANQVYSTYKLFK